MEMALYLIPITLGDTDYKRVLPEFNREIIINIKHFIVESRKAAVRFLIKTSPLIDIDALTFYELNEHTDTGNIHEYLEPLKKNLSVGVITDAGCPAIADPGADIVSIAQKKKIKVVPLVGPSSILLSLMGSGFNGQSFAFNGYLPAKSAERTSALKKLEQKVWKENQTQIFIETPYRNARMIETILNTCRPETKLCIAANLTCPEEYLKTLSIAEWKKQGQLELGKNPAIFLIYK